MAKPNYQRDKRQRDLARQRKQEEKRQKKAMKGTGVTALEEPQELSAPVDPDSEPSGEMTSPE